MEAIQKTAQTPSNQGVQPSTPNTTPQAGSSDFDQTLKGLLKPDSANNVSEEELFSALVQERIKKTKGDAALGEFKTSLDAWSQKLRKPDGFVPVEEATKQALMEFRNQQKLSAEEADSIYSQSFAAAQLDANTEALFDNRGGANDPTMAVAAMEQALLLSRAAIEQFDSGAVTPTRRSIEEASMGGTSAATTAAGSSGFLFKPQAEKDGKLVVLLPSRLTGLVKGVTLIGPNGEVIESGRYSGVGNGGREHFRFSQAGGNYPDGVTVQVALTTNEMVKFFIRETSERDESDSSGGQESGQNQGSSGDSGSSNGDSSRQDNSL